LKEKLKAEKERRQNDYRIIEHLGPGLF